MYYIHIINVYFIIFYKLKLINLETNKLKIMSSAVNNKNLLQSFKQLSI